MNKKTAILGATFGVAFSCLAAAPGSSVPKGFTDDLGTALKTSAATGRRVLAVFSGSDWCYWCKKLEGEYLSKDDFVKNATNAFELVFLDFPRDKSVLSPLAKKCNAAYAKEYGITGLPTVYVLDEKGKVLGPARPKDGETPAGYAVRLKKDFPPVKKGKGGR